MGKTVAVVQSNYVPWKGYFDLIRTADEFVLYDDVQYTRRDWRNRNKIKTPDGVQWLTIPVDVKGKFTQTIRETATAGGEWADNHRTRLHHAYGRAPFYTDYRETIDGWYAAAAELRSLSEVNALFLRQLCPLLGITTPIRDSADFKLDNPDPTGRLRDICVQSQATEYLSGPAARAYLDESVFERAGVAVRYMDYAGYPEYPQLHGPFDHAVSVLDLLFMTGPRARDYLARVPDPSRRAG